MENHRIDLSDDKNTSSLDKVFLQYLCPLIFLCAALPATAEKRCDLRETTPITQKPSVDKIIWGEDTVALIEGVSSDLAHNTDWAGPVVSVNPDGSERCRANIENLKRPFVLGEGRYFYYVSGDAVDFRVQQLDLQSCQIKWESKVHEWTNVDKVQYKNGQIWVGKTKYAIPANCLIGSGPPQNKKRP